MNEPQNRPRDQQQPMSRRERVDKVCDEFEQQWRAGQEPQIETFVDKADAADRDLLLRELVRLEIELRREAGEQVGPGDYDRFPGRFCEWHQEPRAAKPVSPPVKPAPVQSPL